jgi:hypothetical protein
MKMILLYTTTLFLLGTLKVLVSWRARILERKFVRIAADVDQMLREPAFKPGNSNKADACVSAKRMIALGELALARDRVEAKYFAWQRWSDRCAGWVNAVSDWKGKKLPYTLGAVDVWMLLYTVDYLGVGQYLSANALIDALTALWTN